MNKSNIQNLLILLTLYRIYRLNFPHKVKDLAGQNILVTGAGGSLGFSLVKEFCQRRVANLVLWDINQIELEKVKQWIQERFPNIQVHTQNVNLASRQAIYNGASTALATCPIDIVVNNAGVTQGKFLLENKDEFDQLTFDVNALCHVWMTKAFLPQMEKRGTGHFVNVSSMASYVATTSMTTYAASKFAARGFSEALNHELRYRKSPVKVTCVCPSQFQSSLFDGFFVLGNLAMTAEYVAGETVKGIEAERELILLPRYLLGTIPLMGAMQALGYFNIPPPPFGENNPMANWKGNAHATKMFETMSGNNKL
jgi:all-trans-retinol dehydrogenase (NAD+)